MEPSPLSPLQLDQLAAFAAAVRASPHNLLSQRGLDELDDRHIGESLGFALSLPGAGGDLLDIGTGGGFPGMVIAITRPDFRVTLLDGTAKKIAFLAAFVAEHNLPVATVNARAEDAARTMAQSFDVVTARAVAPLERLIPWGLPFLRPGGALYAIKGERWAEELKAALPAIKRLRATVAEVTEPVLSTGSGSPAVPRTVIIHAAS